MCGAATSTAVAPTRDPPATPAAAVNLEPLISGSTAIGPWSQASPGPWSPLDAPATLYPDWENWRFRRTLAYWITVMYLEGSILFTVGGAFAFFPPHLGIEHVPPGVAAATVSAPYLVGSVAFTLGGWAGMEEVLRLPDELRGSRRPRLFCLASRRHWRQVKKATSSFTIAGFAAYFVGALLFNVNCLANFLARGIGATELWVWSPAVLGSAGFVVGGLAECNRSRVWSGCLGLRRRGLRSAFSVVAVLSVCNLTGGALFLLAALSGALHVADPTLFDEAFAHWMSDGAYLLRQEGLLHFGRPRDGHCWGRRPTPRPALARRGRWAALGAPVAQAAQQTRGRPGGGVGSARRRGERRALPRAGAYLLGSLLFVAGSLCGLWMWKAEQYGLGQVTQSACPRLPLRPPLRAPHRRHGRGLRRAPTPSPLHGPEEPAWAAARASRGALHPTVPDRATPLVVLHASVPIDT